MMLKGSTHPAFLCILRTGCLSSVAINTSHLLSQATIGLQGQVVVTNHRLLDICMYEAIGFVEKLVVNDSRLNCI